MTLLSVTEFDILLQSIVVMLLAILIIGAVLKKLNQPYFVAYIIAGIVLGPHITGTFTNTETIGAIGEFGLLIQMFFIGMKMEVQALAKNVRKPLGGVLVQVIFSILFIGLLGWSQQWNWKQIIVFGFITSLSSSAIILEYLEKNKELTNPLGTLTSGILILQDLLLVPMLLLVNIIGNKASEGIGFVPLLIGAAGITLLLRSSFIKPALSLPFLKKFRPDHDLQVFTALLLCLGFAWLTHLLHFSAAIGALLGGILVSHAAAFNWLDTNLRPFRVFFLSLFFMSIGLQLNLDFLLKNIQLIITIVAIVMIINSVINAFAFRMMGENIRNSLYAGALLSQLGEFSIVICLVARGQGIVNDFWYQLTLAVVSVTMLTTAAWIKLAQTLFVKKTFLKKPVLRIREFEY